MRITIGRNNLKEAKQMLSEFTKADLGSLMEIENQFTVSYEVELETKSSMFSTGESGSAEEEYERAKEAARDGFTTAISEDRVEDAWGTWDDMVNRGSHSGTHSEELNIIEYIEDNVRPHSGPLLDMSSDTFLAEMGVFFAGAEILSQEIGVFKRQMDKEVKIHGASLMIKLAKTYPDLSEKLRSVINMSATAILTLDKIKTMDFEAYQFADYLIASKISTELVPLKVQDQILTLAMQRFISYYYISGLFDFEESQTYDFGKMASSVDFAEPSFATICDELRVTSVYEQLYNRGLSFLRIITDGKSDVSSTIMELERFPAFVRMTPVVTKIVKSVVDTVVNELEGIIDSYVEDMMDVWERDNPIDNFYDQYGFGVPDDEDSLASTYEDTVSKYLPNFYRRFGRELKFESDGSLDNETGLEFSLNTYLDGLSEAIEFLDLFFEDYDSQNFLFMSKRTGMHINIGHKSVGDGEENEFNLIKGFLFLSEDVDQASKAAGAGKRARAMKGLPASRVMSRWTGAIAPTKIENELPQEAKARMVADKIRGSIGAMEKNSASARAATTLGALHTKKGGFDLSSLSKDFLSSFGSNSPSVLEKMFGDILMERAQDLGPKSVGFNINYTRGKFGDDDVKYVEFRFPGHEIDLETAKDLTMYYAYLIRHMVDKSYMKAEYAKKLVSLLTRTAESRLPTLGILETIMKAGNPFILDYPAGEAFSQAKIEHEKIYNAKSRGPIYFLDSEREVLDGARIIASFSFTNAARFAPFSFALAAKNKTPLTSQGDLSDVEFSVPVSFSKTRLGFPALITKVEGEGLSAKIEMEVLVFSLEEQSSTDQDKHGVYANPEYSPLSVKKITVTATGADIMAMYSSRTTIEEMYPTTIEGIQASGNQNYKKLGKLVREVFSYVDSAGGSIPVKPTKV